MRSGAEAAVPAHPWHADRHEMPLCGDGATARSEGKTEDEHDDEDEDD